MNLVLTEKLKHQPIHQWVYHILRENIIALRLQPGQTVSETDLAENLAISRTPVREAFIRLAEDGLLEIQPQKGSVIALIDIEQAEEARFIRRAVEKSIIKEACADFPAAGRAILAANIETQAECRRNGDFETLLRVDNEFHRQIYRDCRKERIWLYLRKLGYNHDRLRIMTLQEPDTMDRVIDEHSRILGMISGKTTEGVEDLVESHLTGAVINRIVLQYPARYFRQDPHACLAAGSPIAIGA